MLTYKCNEEYANQIYHSARGRQGNHCLLYTSCTCSPANEIELLVDSDTSVSIDACAALSRAVEAAFDREGNPNWFRYRGYGQLSAVYTSRNGRW